MQPGAVIGEAWELYKAHWRHFLPIALVVFAGLALVSLLLAAAFGWFGVVLGALINVVGIFLLQGALVEAVADVRDGRADLSIGDTFRAVRPRLGTLVVAGVLAGLGIVLGLLALVIPGLVLMTWWSVLMPAIVLERADVMEGFGRSRELVRGNGWNVFGVIVLTFVILIAAGILLNIALFWLPDELQSFLQNLIGNTITVPFIAVALTMTYYALGGRGRERGSEPA